MSYQIPSQVKAEFLLGETTVSLYNVKPTKDVKFRHAVITMYLRGHVGSDFKMRINVYKDATKNTLLMQSNTVNNLDIARTGNYYAEIRFDFPVNIMSVGHDHLVEFEIFDGYTYSATDYVALILGTQEMLGFVGSDLVDPNQASKLGHQLAFFFDQIETQNDEKFFMVSIAGMKILDRISTREFWEETPGAPFDDGGWMVTATLQPGLYIEPGSDGVQFIDHSSGASTQNLTRVSEPIFPITGDYEEHLETYYYDPETGAFEAFTEQDFGNGTVSISLFVKYRVFFTEFIGRYADPDMLGGPVNVYWEPRIYSGLEFGYDQENAFSGILSVTASSIAMKNQDRYFNQFFSPHDSFNNRQVKVWSCIGGTENPTLEFLGTIRAASLNDKQCVFDIQDILSTLDQVFDDGLPKTYAEMSAYTSVTAMKDDDRLKPVYRHYGWRSPYEVEYYEPTGVADFRQLPKLSGEKMVPLVNVSRNTSLSTSVNRTWSLGFGPGNVNDLTLDCTLHTHLSLGSFDASILTLDPDTVNTGKYVNDFFAVGDTFQNGSQYGIVFDVTNTEIYVWPYNASFSASNNVVRKAVSALVIIKGEDKFYPIAGRDYSCSIGADGDTKITFVNNFEANHSGLGTLDPDAVEIYGRLYMDGADAKASSLLKGILDLVGDPIDTAAIGFAPDQQASVPGNDQYGSIDSETSYPDPALSFTVPFVGESEFPTFRDVVEKILKSVMGFIYFDDVGDIRYKSFLDSNWQDFANGGLGPYPAESFTSDYIENQSGITPEDGEINETNSSDLNVKFDLYDSFCGISFNFSHAPMRLPVFYSFSTGLGTSLSKVTARHFYNTSKVYEVECLADPGATYFKRFAYRFSNLVTGRRASYTLKAFTSQGIYLGDDLLLSRVKIVGSDGESFMRVISLSKAINEQRLSLLDLRRFAGNENFP